MKRVWLLGCQSSLLLLCSVVQFRCRFGVFHILNNDYSEGWDKYAIGGSENPTILSEGNYFRPTREKEVRFSAQIAIHEHFPSTLVHKRITSVALPYFWFLSTHLIKQLDVECPRSWFVVFNLTGILFWSEGVLNPRWQNASMTMDPLSGAGRTGTGFPAATFSLMDHTSLAPEPRSPLASTLMPSALRHVLGTWCPLSQKVRDPWNLWRHPDLTILKNCVEYKMG